MPASATVDMLATLSPNVRRPVPKLAISSGTWTINPAQSLNIFVLGTLPIEEFIFFFMTNLLVALGVILLSSTASKRRFDDVLQAVKHRRKADREERHTGAARKALPT